MEENQHHVLEQLKALEQRIAHLEHSIHPDQLTKEVTEKIATHLRSLGGAHHQEHVVHPSPEHGHTV